MAKVNREFIRGFAGCQHALGKSLARAYHGVWVMTGIQENYRCKVHL